GLTDGKVIHLVVRSANAPVNPENDAPRSRASSGHRMAHNAGGVMNIISGMMGFVPMRRPAQQGEQASQDNSEQSSTEPSAGSQRAFTMLPGMMQSMGPMFQNGAVESIEAYMTLPDGRTQVIEFSRNGPHLSSGNTQDSTDPTNSNTESMANGTQEHTRPRPSGSLLEPLLGASAGRGFRVNAPQYPVDLNTRMLRVHSQLRAISELVDGIEAPSNVPTNADREALTASGTTSASQLSGLLERWNTTMERVQPRIRDMQLMLANSRHFANADQPHIAARNRIRHSSQMFTRAAQTMNSIASLLNSIQTSETEDGQVLYNVRDPAETGGREWHTMASASTSQGNPFPFGDIRRMFPRNVGSNTSTSATSGRPQGSQTQLNASTNTSEFQDQQRPSDMIGLVIDMPIVFGHGFSSHAIPTAASSESQTSTSTTPSTSSTIQNNSSASTSHSPAHPRPDTEPSENRRRSKRQKRSPEGHPQEEASTSQAADPTPSTTDRRTTVEEQPEDVEEVQQNSSPQRGRFRSSCAHGIQ
ncbi:hypothetical protein BZG36_00645, partial [Bifiguratus adelaidae]